MRVEKQVAVGLLVVLLVLGVVVGAKYFSAWQLSTVSADDLGSGGVQSASANWEVLALGYNYVVKTDGSLYWAEASDALKHWIDGNKTYVFDQVFTAMPSGGSVVTVEVQVPAMTIPDNIFVVENYQGTQKLYSNQGKWLLPQLAADPSTATWGSAEKGRIWFNTVEGKIKFWDGVAVQVLPSVAGGSSSYKLSDTYTIYTVMGTVYAVDEDGNLDYSSSSATTLFNQVSSALNSLGGGSVFSKSGDYSFTDHVNADVSNVLWHGQGQTTHLQLASGRPNAAGDWSKWCIFYAATSSENVTIRDMWFDGNYAGNNNLGSITHGLAAVYVYGGRHWLVDHCWLTDHRVNGIDFVAYDAESYGNKVLNSYVANTRWNGISFGGGDYDIYDCQAIGNELWGEIGDIALCATGSWDGSHEAHRIVFEDNLIRDMSGTEGSSGAFWCGIKFEFYSNSCEAINNKIFGVKYGVYEAGNAYGNHTVRNNEIHLKDSSSLPEGINLVYAHSLVSFNTVYAPATNDSYGIYFPSDLSTNNYLRVNGNKFINEGSGTMTGIVQGSGDYNYYELNDFTFCDAPFSSGGNVGCKFSNNIGFVTENSVSGANTTATTAVINHGLYSTADFVWCSFSTTAITGYSWSSSATQITVTVIGTLPASWTVYAKVEYVP